MKVINSPGVQVVDRPKPAKKKSPFKNTLKKKNGKYKLGNLIKRARAQARAYTRRCDGAVPEMVAAVEAVEAFGGGELDLRWQAALARLEGRPELRRTLVAIRRFRDREKIIFALKIKAGTYRERISQLTKIFKP